MYSDNFYFNKLKTDDCVLCIQVIEEPYDFTSFFVEINISRLNGIRHKDLFYSGALDVIPLGRYFSRFFFFVYYGIAVL